MFAEFLEVKTIDNYKKRDDYFGINILEQKIWFIDPYNDNTHIIRDIGKQYRKRLNEAKYKNILEKIDKQFDIKNDVELLIVKNLALELGNYIRIKSGKKYFLFTDKINEVVNIPNLKWVRDLIDAKVEINNSEISICYSKYPVTLFFEKDGFILEQYLNNETKEPVDITIHAFKCQVQLFKF
jgi:hypothetical protein